jgi:hypothetical protein
MYDYAAAKFKAKASASPYYDAVLSALVVHEWELHEPVGSKMWAMAAKLASLEEAHELVVEFGTKALALNERAGVKKLVKTSAEMLLQQKQQSEQVPDQDAPTDQVPDQKAPPEQDIHQEE